MSSLTETAQVMRTFLKVAALVLIILTIAVYAWAYAQKSFFAPKEAVAVPTMGYGKLPPPLFPKSQFSLPQLTLEPIKTPNDFPGVAAVWKIQVPKLAFGDKETAVAKAAALGFPKTPTQSNNNTLLFTDTQLKSRTLQVTLLGENFIMRYNFRNDPSVFTAAAQLAPQDYIDKARQFFHGAASLPDDLTANDPIPENFSYSDGQLVPLADASQTPDAVRVNFFPKDVSDTKEDVPIVYDMPNESPTYAIVTANDMPAKQVIEAQQYYFPIADKPETYPTISHDEAFTALKNGNAYIAQSDNSGSVTINEVRLAYFEHGTSFLYPVYIFIGENFTAYVSALKSDAVNTSQTSQIDTTQQNQSSSLDTANNQAAVKGISTENYLEPIAPGVSPRKSGLYSPTQPNRFSDLPKH